MTEPTLDDLRTMIQDIDRRIFTLLAERTELAREVGRRKAAAALPIRNYQVETEVIRRAHELTRHTALSREFVDLVVHAMIRESVSVQLEHRNQGQRTPSDAGTKRCLVLGGAGKMGGWLAGFLRSSGHPVEIVDPAAAAPDSRASLPDDLGPYDVIAVCAPLAATAAVLDEVFARNPRGLVFDIASLKSHLVAPLRAAAARGMNVVSCHPLFGPDVKTLGGRNIILCGVGRPEPVAQLRALFSDTAAHLEEVPLEEHDRFMAYSLGLAHAVNLLFGDILARSGIPFHRLLNFAGTTFMKQSRTSRELFGENPGLYHAIQHLNDHRDDLYASLREAMDRLTASGLDPDPAAMEAVMRDGRAYFDGA